jgi:hypothetical protein
VMSRAKIASVISGTESCRAISTVFLSLGVSEPPRRC